MTGMTGDPTVKIIANHVGVISLVMLSLDDPFVTQTDKMEGRRIKRHR